MDSLCNKGENTRFEITTRISNNMWHELQFHAATTHFSLEIINNRENLFSFPLFMKNKSRKCIYRCYKKKKVQQLLFAICANLSRSVMLTKDIKRKKEERKNRRNIKEKRPTKERPNTIKKSILKYSSKFWERFIECLRSTEHFSFKELNWLSLNTTIFKCCTKDFLVNLAVIFFGIHFFFLWKMQHCGRNSV